MKEQIFSGHWICPACFAELTPLTMYHKENEPPRFGGEHRDDLQNSHVLFRRKFHVKKKNGIYRLRFSADDYGKIYLNGLLIGQGPTPGYLEAYHYCEVDVTDALHDGENNIYIHAYYQGLINRVWISGDNRMGVIADLVAPDNEALLITDETWECAIMTQYISNRKTGYDTQFLEDYDSRRALSFEKVKVREPFGIVFRPHPVPMLQWYDLAPTYYEKLENGGIFYDFGQEITATLNIHATGKSGNYLRILCGEETDDSDVKVRYQMRCNCEYEEIWTLDDGSNRLEQYDYKAFRYVCLIPSSNQIQIESVSATVRHAAFDNNACTLQTDDGVLQSVFEICKNGVKMGTQEIYVDCPTREKGQYAGDMTVTSGAQLWLTGDPFMLEKGIRDQAASATIDPGLMAVMCGSYMQEIADYSLQFPLLLLRHYDYTGDKEFLASMLPVAEKMFDHFSQYARDDGLIERVVDKWNLVDWPDNLRDGYDFPLTIPVGKGVHNVLNAFYVGCAKNIEQIQDILGISHGNRSDKLIESFHQAFFRKELGVYVDSENSSHSAIQSNILPGFYGFVPKEYEKSIGDFLVSRGMACGVYMSYFLMKALCRLGRYEAVYRLITSTEKTSWYNMVREGATTCFEAWGKDQKWNTSLCHPWASAPVIILIEDLLNISPDGTVGECHMPHSVGKIEMRVPTRNGKVLVRITPDNSKEGEE